MIAESVSRGSDVAALLDQLSVPRTIVVNEDRRRTNCAYFNPNTMTQTKTPFKLHARRFVARFGGDAFG